MCGGGPAQTPAPGAWHPRHGPQLVQCSTPADPAAAGVEAASAAEAAAEAAAANDDSLARSVGLHLRGRTATKEGAADEDDPARMFFHKTLKQAAVAGNWREAEAVVEELARAGNVPGPRAYHALVFSYVKGRSPAGALEAIRRCWDAGITPLPETYAAVVHAHVLAGELETAEAVCASNRRAGVDCTKSWQQLVTALFKAVQADKAMEAYSQASRQPQQQLQPQRGQVCMCSRPALPPSAPVDQPQHTVPFCLSCAQGEAEGLQPNEGVFAALIEHMCMQQDLEAAAATLQLMKVKRGVGGGELARQAGRQAQGANKQRMKGGSVLKPGLPAQPAPHECRSAVPARLSSTMLP